jgi:hypothetical protein
MAPHAFSEAIEKPVPLQAFWPLQAFAEPLQALWPLQALPAMHLPAAALAGLVPVVTTAPARNRVAAAAASVADPPVATLLLHLESPPPHLSANIKIKHKGKTMNHKAEVPGLRKGKDDVHRTHRVDGLGIAGLCVRVPDPRGLRHLRPH